MPPATVTALIGPSGCGKSTFLRILNRMHESVPGAQMAGEVHLNGEDIYAAGQRLTDVRKQIGMVFQKPNPFPAMSIADNVAAGLALTNTKVSRIERSRARRGLPGPGRAVERGQGPAATARVRRSPVASSSGCASPGRWRSSPKVLLMDEPCSALDPTSTRRIEETIAELRHQVTIVIVTHNMQQAARVSQQAAFFLAEQGSPGRHRRAGLDDRTSSNSPVDPRTADYVHGRFG